MLRTIGNLGCSVLAVAIVALPGQALAQRANENAVLNADDAFGTNVGLETTGIYSEDDTRGFSPKKAGNYRLDGIYFDLVATISGRLRQSSAIRVGYAASDQPFPAPTGVAETRVRQSGDEAGASLVLTRTQFGGDIEEFDARLPVIRGSLSVAMGYGHSRIKTTDGAPSSGHGGAFKPRLRWNGGEFSPFIMYADIYDTYPRPFTVVSGGELPALPPQKVYLGQDWAKARTVHLNTGATLRTAITDRLSLRAGAFLSDADRKSNYSEIFAITGPGNAARHRFIADPASHLYSWSGEAQLAYRFGEGRWQHRLIAGFRGRDRHTESGGSDVRDFGNVVLGELDPEPLPSFAFSAVNVGRVRQGAWMLGYLGKLDGVGRINLGLQRATYRADFFDARTARSTTSRTREWLTNASLVLDLSKHVSLFAATQRGLEDSGNAPETATNRNELMPATLSTQYEAGARWNFGSGELVLSGFQISKPYFSFDAANVYAPLGTVRHRGIEASLHGHFGKRLSVLAGLVAMDPEVTGPARDLGLVGRRPAGTPNLHFRLDANYRTDLLGGLTPTASLIVTGRRAVGSRPVPGLPDGQLFLPVRTTLDLGLRHQFKLGTLPASLRFNMNNVFDRKDWRVVASNTLWIDERRRFSLSLAADF